MAKKGKKKLRKQSKILIATALGIAVLCAGYVSICAIASGNEFMGNTVINGIEVGKLSKEEAIASLSNQFKQDNDNTLELVVNDKTYVVDTSDVLSFDAAKGVEEVYNQLHDSFLKSGYYYLFGNKFDCGVEIKDLETLKARIAESKILEYDTSIKTTYTIKENDVEFVKGTQGERIVEETLLNDITNALQTYTFNQPITCTLEKSLAGDSSEMKVFHEELSQAMKNATLDRENNYAIVPSQVGVDFNVEEAMKTYDKVNAGETFTVNATVTHPTVTTEDLEKNLFRDVLGSYTTNVSGTKVRKGNVKLAGDYCDGTILLPGEVFSYNGVVGQRTEKRGFGAASAYLNGETIQEVGGGVCQPSSTLYNSVMLANLEIVERYPHSYKSGYVPIGRDATVSWGGPDFKFKNNTDYPIKVTSSYSNSKLTMKIIGTNVDGSYVKITQKQLSSKAHGIVEREDPTLPVGTKKTYQSGYDGATAQTWRHVYDKNGNLISSEKEAYSSYKKRDKIVLVGTKVVETPAPGTGTTPGTTTPPTTETPNTQTTN